MSSIRYMTQPTDMEGMTFRSCLAGFTATSHQTPTCLPEAERMTVNMWSDREGNNVAVEVHDHMDEYGRYHRVRRFIIVPDDIEDMEFDQDRAWTEGWCLSVCSGSLAIPEGALDLQAWNEDTSFTSDEQARAYVDAQAEAGSDYHRRAIIELVLHNNLLLGEHS